ncbi:hypothetical protein TOT_040000329 [Theileria orientalis strain Shintoku]|uniref:Uncharacterized protein n=1 Tax=Theileria orientalis strain Shintoku TaxID=869250 RepID=J4DAF8_THEOR|nr:hypothetical protein TOT_040000329 [Theileria orientalis strain Shintoku]PVC50073.1 hypothetical protein MACL_00002545 [Theileria orientalis]BAM41950.1 hypothetical protein TOT_040000329 [Theileria orientalis strain Shintoku]|eukprot:XP_009692251.1 hypothetical protein TOT_040000329 [Theileria orientalis strain Shintoku]
MQFRFGANFREAHPSMKQRIDTRRRKKFDENITTTQILELILSLYSKRT